MSVEAFLRSMVEDPASAATIWLMLADWLEERDDPRYELVRLVHDSHHRPDLGASGRSERVRQLLAEGMRPLVPMLINSLDMPFALVPAGTFWMGGGGGQPGDRQVEIAQPFFLGLYPVTQGQWQAIMGENPSYFSRTGRGQDKVKDISDEELKHFPVESVSWDDVQEFLKQLHAKEPDCGLLYRLPSEEEWEYTCRGGPISQEQSKYHFYFAKSKTDLTPAPTNDLSSTQANFDGNNPFGSAAMGPYLQRPCQVGLYLPNPLGIYDLHGNVWEWTSSLWEGASLRVNRGGSWSSLGGSCLASSRCWSGPGNAHNNLGFRLLAVPSGG